MKVTGLEEQEETREHSARKIFLKRAKKENWKTKKQAEKIREEIDREADERRFTIS